MATTACSFYAYPAELRLKGNVKQSDCDRRVCPRRLPVYKAIQNNAPSRSHTSLRHILSQLLDWPLSSAARSPIP